MTTFCCDCICKLLLGLFQIDISSARTKDYLLNLRPDALGGTDLHVDDKLLKQEKETDVRISIKKELCSS